MLSRRSGVRRNGCRSHAHYDTLPCSRPLTAPAFQSAATLPATLLSYAPYDIQPAREYECGRTVCFNGMLSPRPPANVQRVSNCCTKSPAGSCRRRKPTAHNACKRCIARGAEGYSGSQSDAFHPTCGWLSAQSLPKDTPACCTKQLAVFWSRGAEMSTPYTARAAAGSSAAIAV